MSSIMDPAALDLPHLVPTWFPPTREHWELIKNIWVYVPMFTIFLWFVPFFGMGKRSIDSPLNIPGKVGWLIMEVPGFLTILYCMVTIPKTIGLTHPLPWGNWTMAGMYTVHYLYRAIAYPLMAPSMSPMHISVCLSAIAFNIMNGLSIGGWLAGYGPSTTYDWSGKLYTIQVGMVIWGWGLLANIFHDDDLREIRRSALRRQKELAEKEGKPLDGVKKFYMIPKNGLFHYVLYAHYFCEWIEWAGFWMVGGWECVPARSFLFAEIATMLPQAVQGKEWYIQRFGKEKVGNRKAIIPGIL